MKRVLSARNGRVEGINQLFCCITDLKLSLLREIYSFFNFLIAHLCFVLEHTESHQFIWLVGD